MRISQIMLGKGFGGAERYFLDLCHALAKTEHTIQVICHRDFVELSSLQSLPNIQLEMIPVWGKWDPTVPLRLLKSVRKFRPDIIQAHLARGAYLAGKAARKARIPLIVKTHNYVNMKYYKNVDHFIATTKDQQTYLHEQGIANSDISVIPNFSRMQPDRTARRKSSDTTTIVSLGRFVHKKGFDLLLNSFAALIQSGFKVRLLIGGDGPERQGLENMTKTLGISDHVNFPGWIDDVKSFLEQGDVFVLPSRDEPFGIAVLEAMASNIPIVATLTQGPSEILDKHTAWLVPINNSNALYEALANLISNPHEATQRAELALQLYSERYHEDAVVPQLINLYKNLLIQHTSPTQ